jgi:hypothetical protein
MEFKRVPIVGDFERKLDQQTSQLDPDQIRIFMRDVEKADISRVIKELKIKHPFYSALTKSKAETVVMALFAFGFGLLFTPANSYISVFILIFAVYLSVCKMFIKDFVQKKTKERCWQRSPFANFVQEYTGEVLSKICGCHKTSGCLVDTHIFTVMHHPSSDTRFLLVSGPEDMLTDVYYIDSFERSKDSALPPVNKVAEVLDSH